MKTHFDAIVIGAGPAGLSCASALTGFGLEVLLLDEQTRPGGQIYKNIENVFGKRLQILGEDYAAGQKLVSRFRRQKLDYVPSAAVWQVEEDGHVYYSCEGSSFEVFGKFIVAATGAMERPVPFPGWTLPGVMGAGGASNLIKDAGLMPKGKVVLAGSGPLLFLEAVHLIDMGADIRAILETTSVLPHLSSLFHLPAAVRRTDFLKKGMSMLQRIKKAGIKHYKGITRLAARGEENLESVHAQKGEKQLDFEADLLLTHFGVIPNTAIFRQIGCRHAWNEVQRYWYPECDKWGRTSHNAIFAAGDGKFVHGAVAAALKGEMAALAITADMGMIHESECSIWAGQIEKQLARDLYPRPFIDALYAPAPDLYEAAPETIVCRCESITMGQINRVIKEGCIDPNEIKALLRPGMGACQGRMCGSALSEIISLRSGIDIKAVGTLNIRPPLKNISLQEIADIELCEG
ncbi:MAG: FAD-dependent oxidoreductase [Desulfobacula sp.]|uniref:FAD-dependent oxidoreductase n=1 Tax=Desulfobacula sp. TaxID=2593537 RepID=UPI001ECE755B|nr:FAD-dependent oxidoreductase [Desulfobacula sp.]MBT5544897.1 FAD-dependent oxidoreductase [Desulfobacula sp.]